MIKIIPAILTNDLSELEEMVSRCEGVADRVQVDVIDGVFADNKTLDPALLADIDTNLNIDFHLMVKEPINWVEKCVSAGADRVIGQIEKMSDQIAFVGKVQEVGLSVGLAVDLTTSISELDSTILTDLDVVLVMSVPAGFGGQEFDKKALEKIKKLDEIRQHDSTPYKICDDGGITLESVYNVHRLGADEVSIGRRIFKGELRKNLRKFQLAAHNLVNHG